MGTELDKATQSRLDRGYRMVELLKQPQYNPMHVLDQVMSIFAGTRGYMDDVPIKDVRTWEQAFVTFMHAKRADVVDELTKANDMTDAIATKLVAAIQDFKAGYKPAAGRPKSA